jgi:hypothetical protein
LGVLNNQIKPFAHYISALFSGFTLPALKGLFCGCNCSLGIYWFKVSYICNELTGSGIVNCKSASLICVEPRTINESFFFK